MRKIKNNKGGYTIIETMISVSIFIVVVMTGMGSLLSANLIHQKSRDMRSIMDNLNFIMEDMSRNLRTGYSYECFNNVPTGNVPPVPASCDGDGQAGIYFIATDPGSSGGASLSNLAYFIGGPDPYSVFRKVDNKQPVQLTPDEIKISASSGFVVLGAERNDGRQPLVTIRLLGDIDYKGTKTPFSLQTSVSQRQIDL
jgi:type II secretory pathway pseudopilin PulG